MTLRSPIWFALLGLIFFSCGTRKLAVVDQPLNESNDSAELKQWYTQAEISFLKQDYSEATKWYKACLEQYQSASAAWRLAEIELIGASNYTVASDKAFEYLNKAIDLDPQNAWYKIRKAEIYLNRRDYLKSAEIFDSLSIQYPTNYSYYRDACKLYLSVKPEQIFIVTQRWAQRRGFIEEIALLDIDAAERSGNYSKGLIAAQRLILKYPERLKYRWLKLDLLEKMGDQASWEKELDTIALLDPSDPKPLGSLVALQIKNNQPAKAIQYAQQLVQNFGSQTGTIELMVDYGNKLLALYPNPSDSFALSAMAPIKSMLALQPKANALKICLIQWEFAAKHYSQIHILAKEVQEDILLNADIWSIWLKSLELSGQFTELHSTAELMTDYYPSLPLPYVFQAKALIYQTQLDKAKVQLDQAKSLYFREEPFDELNIALAIWNFKKGNLAESEKYVEMLSTAANQSFWPPLLNAALALQKNPAANVSALLKDAQLKGVSAPLLNSFNLKLP